MNEYSSIRDKKMKTVSVVVGSLRRESINLKLAKALIKLAVGQSSAYHFKLVDIGELPVYNEDLWEKTPTAVTEFKQHIADSSAVLFVTPEYNRTIPSPLKNALDWGSRPSNDNSWRHKPAAIIGTSPGQIGTAVAQSHLRSVLPVLSIEAMPQPEIYLKFEDDLIDERYDITSEKTKEYLQKFLAQFEAYLKKNDKSE